MYIFKLIVPGSELNLCDDIRTNIDVKNRIFFLTNFFYDANLALGLFIEENKRNLSALRKKRFYENRSRSKDVSNEPIRSIPLTFEEEVEYANEVNYNDTLSQYLLPMSFEFRIKFIYANAYIFALDYFRKELSKLSEITLIKEKVDILLLDFDNIFPNIIKLRNSLHHLEDRSRRIKHRTKPINVKPVKNELINDSFGSATVLGSFIDNKYGCLLDDGTYGQIEISIDVMSRLQEQLQSFLNSLDWKGYRNFLPML